MCFPRKMCVSKLGKKNKEHIFLTNLTWEFHKVSKAKEMIQQKSNTEKETMDFFNMFDFDNV